MTPGKFLHDRKRKYYDDIASVPGLAEARWACTKPAMRTSYLVAILNRYGVDTFVEIGCGTGALVALYENAIGVDISYAMLRETKMATLGRARCVQGAAEYLPFQAGSVSNLVTDGTYQGVKGKSEFLSEIARVLAPGGYAFIGIVNRDPAQPQWEHHEITLEESSTLELTEGMKWNLSTWRKQ